MTDHSFGKIFRRASALLGRKKWQIVGTVLVLAGLTAIMPVWMMITARGDMYSPQNAPRRDVAIVFGAGALPDGTPTNFLESRLLAAAQLYQAKKIKVIVVSGDNRTSHYDEPSVMKRYLIAHHVPANKVVADYAGRSTYDTCWRVHFLFGVNEAILVTHGYHLPRALFTCNQLGLKSVGVKADRSSSSFSKSYLIREVASDNKAAIELFFKVKPAVGGGFEDAVLRALMRQ